MIFDGLVDGVLGNVIGGSTGTAIQMGMFILFMLLVVVLLAARLDFISAILIVSPGILVAAFGGALPSPVTGIIVLFLAFVWGGIILSLFSQ